MKFGVIFASSQHPPWSQHYIDYLRLKKLLHVLFDRESDELETSFVSADNGHSVTDVHGLSGENVASSYYEVHDGGVTRAGFLNQSYAAVDSHESSPPLQHVVADSRDRTMLRVPPLSHNDLQTNNEAMTSRDFQRELNQEIQKAVLFILTSMGELASQLATLMHNQKVLAAHIRPLLDMGLHSRTQDEQGRKRQQILRDNRYKEINDLRMDFLAQIGSKLLLLLEFVDLNVTAVTKIVKKHDKCFAQWEESSQNFRRRMHSLSISTSQCEETSRYQRLRRQYLPRFARFSSDPNIRCLFLLAADAGDCSYSMDSSAKQNRNHESDGSFGGWDVMQWNLDKSLRDLFDWTQALKAPKFAPSESERVMEEKEPEVTETAVLLRSRSKSMAETRQHQSSLQREKPVSGFLGLHSIASLAHLVTIDDTTTTARHESTFFEPILYRIQFTRRRLGQTTDRYSRMVYAHEMLHIIEDRNIKQEEDERYLLEMQRMTEKKLGHGDEEGEWMESYQIPMVSELSKILNLMSSCLFMCNYNIVAPTSGLYANLLGCDPANAGIIIGMTPLAVIVSSILYSWWTSYSYKRALLFASLCCIVGNTVYAMALPFNSLAMVLIGRVLIGFGSARVISRRYIADYYSIETRTAGMASFVSASAFGMAIGPMLAASFSLIAPHGEIMHHPTLRRSWTVETAPGWVMAMFWLIYFVLNAIYFEEPDRTKPNVNSTLNPKVDLEKAREQKLLPECQASPIYVDIRNVVPKQWSSCNVPVLLSLLVLLLMKIVLEAFISCTPMVSRYYFGWGSQSSGIFLALLASLVLPVNFFVANVSRRYDDREMMLVTLGVMLVGVLGFLVYSELGIAYSESRFIAFGLVIFCSCNAIEAPTMGLLSKTIPKSMASGILNAGLLATEAGAIGRVIGDFYLSASAFKGIERVVNLTFEPMALAIVLTILGATFNYRLLQPRYEDEEDED